jgi:hypothetical protein
VADRDFILEGERAALGMLRREHLPLLASWFNDPEVRGGLATEASSTSRPRSAGTRR